MSEILKNLIYEWKQNLQINFSCQNVTLDKNKKPVVNILLPSIISEEWCVYFDFLLSDCSQKCIAT